MRHEPPTAAQVDEQPLQARFEFVSVVVGLLESQAFELSGTRKTFCNLVFGFVVGEHDDFNALFPFGDLANNVGTTSLCRK